MLHTVIPGQRLSVLIIKCMGFVAAACHSEVILVHLSGQHLSK